MNAECEKQYGFKCTLLFLFFLEITPFLKQLEDNDKSPRLVIKKLKRKILLMSTVNRVSASKMYSQ
jgi:hypothetical protein